jgi:hypothetical protein
MNSGSHKKEIQIVLVWKKQIGPLKSICQTDFDNAGNLTHTLTRTNGVRSRLICIKVRPPRANMTFESLLAEYLLMLERR